MRARFGVAERRACGRARIGRSSCSYRALILAIELVVGCLVLAACSFAPGAAPVQTSAGGFASPLAGDNATRAGAPQVGRPAPAIRLEMPDGSTVSLDQFRGKTVVVNFWATWCEPCRNEFPALQQIYEAESDTVVVLGINQGDTLEQIAAYTAQMRTTFPVAVNQDLSVGAQFLVRGLPTTYFVGPDGVVRQRVVGELKKDQLLERIRLTQQASTPAAAP